MAKKTILIADDDPALVQVVSKRCEALGLNVKRAYNSFNALAIIRGQKPDLVCCDVDMPDGNGLAACEILSTNSKWSWIPIIVLTGREDAGTIKKCHELGAYYVLKGENIWQRLEPLIRELLEIDGKATSTTHSIDAQTTPDLPIVRSHKRSKNIVSSDRSRTLIVIDHDIVTVRLVEAIVAPLGMIVLQCEGLVESTQVFEQAAAVLCEFHLNALQGAFVVSELRRMGLNAPVIMMSHDGSRRTVIESVASGVDAFLSKPVNEQQLLETLRRLTGLQLEAHPQEHACA